MTAADQPPKHSGIGEAEKTELDSLVRTLGRAFEHDPFVHWLISPGADYLRRVEGFYRVLMFEFARRQGIILRTNDLKGVALWYPPGDTELSPFGQLRAVPAFVSIVGMLRLPRRLRGLMTIQDKHPSRPHYYLQAIGVEPSHQGRGYSSALINPVLKRCDNEGLGAYLESSKAENIPVYRRFGFEVTEEVPLSRHGPSVWLMWRSPR